MSESDAPWALAVESSGLSIEPSPYATSDPPDLIAFVFRGKRGAVKAEATMTAEAARHYYDKLGRLLGSEEERP